MTTYRKIYEDYFGPIPTDESGRTFEIHHTDGDHSNNSIENLKAVSIQEHYDIHYAQEDWGACLRIAQRMEISPETKSLLCSLQQKRAVIAGTHPWLGGKIQSKSNKERIENGTHHLLSGEQQSTIQNNLIARGKHNFQKKENIKKRVDKLKKYVKYSLENGTHISQLNVTCPHCGKTMNKIIANRWHFSKCKLKDQSNLCNLDEPLPSSHIVQESIQLS